MSPEDPPILGDPPKDASIPKRPSQENPTPGELKLNHLPVQSDREDFARQIEVISGIRLKDDNARRQFAAFMESLAQALETYTMHGNAEPLAEIDDVLLRIFLLTEQHEAVQGQPTPIETGLGRIQKSITEYLRLNPRKVPINPSDIAGQLRLRIRGMESMVNFLHARSAEPLPEGYSRNFYTQTRLDARFSVDAIEVIERINEGAIEVPELNLIQVKSSEPASGEVKDIQDTHGIVWRELWGNMESANQAIAESFRLTPEQLGGRVENLIWICAEVQAGGSPDEFLDALTAEVIGSAEQYGVNPDYLRQASPALRAKRLTPVLRSFLRTLGERFDKAFKALEQISRKPEGVPPQQPLFVRNPAAAKIKEANSLIIVGERDGSYRTVAKKVIASGYPEKPLILRSRRVDPRNKKG